MDSINLQMLNSLTIQMLKDHIYYFENKVVEEDPNGKFIQIEVH
jgi:hypothetical protein